MSCTSYIGLGSKCRYHCKESEIVLFYYSIIHHIEEMPETSFG